MEFHLHSNVAQVIQTFAPENSIKRFKIQIYMMAISIIGYIYNTFGASFSCKMPLSYLARLKSSGLRLVVQVCYQANACAIKIVDVCIHNYQTFSKKK